MASNDAGTISLADIRAQGLTFDVYEALAIVQAVCRDILDSDNPIPPARLDLDRVFISDDGTVTASAAAGEDEAAGIQSLGKLLSQLLPSVDFLLLRPRVVAKAMATPPGFATLDEFSRALGSYQRPGGAETLKALYQRWQKRSGSAPAPDFKLDDVSEPPPPRSRALQTVLRAAILLVLLGGIGTGGYWLWVHRARFFGTARTASASGAQDGSQSPEAASADAGTGRADSQPPPARGAGAPAATGSSSAARSASAGRSANASGSSRAGAGAARRAAVRGSETASSAPSASEGGPAAASASTRPAAADSPVDDVDVVAVSGGLDGLAVYTARNSEVEPPTVIYPQRLVPVLGTRQPDRPAIEIVVNESGTVDSVKAYIPPRTLGESVVVTTSLSAAKAWRFHPALRDGRPVKYRLLVTFAEK